MKTDDAQDAQDDLDTRDVIQKRIQKMKMLHQQVYDAIEASRLEMKERPGLDGPFVDRGLTGACGAKKNYR